jgi:hypothetical protein
MSRKAAEAFFLDALKQMPDPGRNIPLYKEVFAEMTNAEFDAVMERLGNGSFIMPIYVYNMDEARIDEHVVMKYGKSIGVKYFQKITITDHVTGEKYTSPVEYLCLHLPARRLIQHLTDKLSTADSSRVVDHLAGQATGESKSASISQPELVVLNAKGLKIAPLEFIKVRGGDDQAYQAMQDQIAETGSYSMGPIMDLNSKPKAVETLKYLLLGIHIDSNLTGQM